MSDPAAPIRESGRELSSADAMSIARTDWPRLLALVEQALDVPVADRDAWVASLGLPGALQDALHGLLEDRLAIETDGFLAALPVLPGARPPASPPARAWGRGARCARSAKAA